MAIQLNVNKTLDETKKEVGRQLILNLQKVGMTRVDAKSRVALFLDISGSTEELYARKLMHAITTRVGGIALNLDDNGDLDVFVFNSGVRQLAGFTAANADTYIEKNVARLVGGGTNYAPPLDEMRKFYGPGDPVFAIFLTDGENNDQGVALDSLIALSYHGPIFVQTVGVGLNSRETFDNLQEMNNLDTVDKGGPRLIDNAGFCQIDFQHATEEDVYNALLNEYPSFLAKAKAAGYIPWTKSPLAPMPKAKRSGWPF